MRAHRNRRNQVNHKLNLTVTIARSATLAATLGAILFLGACHKKTAPPPPPPPPAPTAPTASLSANPNTINQGQSTTLTWQTTNATDVSIDGIGPVDTSGQRQVTPADSTTYHLVAKGAGGTQDATARVTVNAAPAPPPVNTTSATEEELFAQNVKDIYFDYDKADIRRRIKHRSRQTRRSCSSILTSTSPSRDIAMNVDRPSTIWLWAPTAPTP